MQSKSNDKGMKRLCGIMFLVFALLWLCFFQVNLLNDVFRHVLQELFKADNVNLHYLILPVVLALIITLLGIPFARLFRFKDGLYACNYLVPALLLGASTAFESSGSSILSGPSTTVWIVTAVFSAVLFIICKIIQAVPRQSVMNVPRVASGNLLIMTLLFCLVGYLGNTDENLHRRLMMERLYAQSEYEKILEIGRLEEESDPAIDLLRAQAMLNLPAEPASSKIGEQLFSYSISAPQSLSQSLKETQNEQAILASNLLDKDLNSFRAKIKYESYKILPKYYMQALVIANDSIARTKFPQQYAEEKSLYDSFCQTLEPVESESPQYQSNTTYIKYHTTYFWYYTFKK